MCIPCVCRLCGHLNSHSLLLKLIMATVQKSGSRCFANQHECRCCRGFRKRRRCMTHYVPTIQQASSSHYTLNRNIYPRFFLMYLFCNESMAIQWQSVCVYKVGVVVSAEFRNQVRQRTIIIILRLDFVLFFFNNLSPIPSFHSFFMFLHSCYTHHP